MSKNAYHAIRYWKYANEFKSGICVFLEQLKSEKRDIDLADLILEVDRLIKGKVWLPIDFFGTNIHQKSLVHPELETLVSHVSKLERLFQRTVILVNSGSGISIADEWTEPMKQLESLLASVAVDDLEVSRYLYNKSLKRQREGTIADTLNAGRELTRKQQRVFDCIKEHGPITAKQIAEKLGIASSTVASHFIPRLRRFGVRNDRNGYYVKGSDDVEG